jgi:hypothetical protein
MLLFNKFFTVSFPRRRESSPYRKSIITLIVSILCFILYTHNAEAAEQLESLKREEQKQASKKLGNILDQMKNLFEELSLVTEGQCMLAVGNQTFCKCISQKTPQGIDFVGYVTILAKTKEELKYDTLSPQDKGIVDTARKAREVCVTSQ